MAGAAAALARGLPVDARPRGAAHLRRRPHRLEEVAVRDGVTYVNDSKATNVAAALVALASFAQPLHVILGGQGKGEDYAPLRAGGRRARARAVYLIGDEAPALRSALESAGVALHDSGDARRRGGAGARRGAARRRRPARPRLHLLRPVRELRGPRGGIPGGGAKLRA